MCELLMGRMKIVSLVRRPGIGFTEFISCVWIAVDACC